MKAATLRNAIEAHGWVGVILSLPLFVVFWAGAVSLFYPELALWSALPVISAEPSPPTSRPITALIDQKLSEVPPVGEEPTWVFLASDRAPFHLFFIPVGREDGSPEEGGVLRVDPRTGATVTVGHPFELARFLFELHFTFHLPFGNYIVGVVTLFFLVMLMTGIVIQLKNLIADFFLYRHERGKRQRLNDIHTVSGVVTLPFAGLYALTGLIFNLSILFQLPTLALVYRGDEDAAMSDAALDKFPSKPAAGIAAPMPELDSVLERFEEAYGAQATILTLNHYGDENASVEIQGKRTAGFPVQVTKLYDVASDRFLDSLSAPSGPAVSPVVGLLLRLHVVKFGGPGVRLMFYLMALGICGMIIAGNWLWLVKREAKRAAYARSFAAVRGLTLGGCTGVVVATAVALGFERLLPVSVASRGALVPGIFVAVLAIVTVAGFFVQHVRPFLRCASWATAGLLLVHPLIDLTFYRLQMTELFGRGYGGPVGVSLGLLVHAALFAWLGAALGAKPLALDLAAARR